MVINDVSTLLQALNDFASKLTNYPQHCAQYRPNRFDKNS